MIVAFQRALTQLPDPAFRGVVIKSVVLTVLLYAVLIWAALYIVPPLIQTDWSWLDWLAEAAGLVVFLVAAFLFFPAIATLFASLFLEQVAAAVEARHYPGDVPGQGVDNLAAFVQSLRFTATALALNLLALPIYLVGFLLPPLNIIVFYGLNGYLLSREYFELVSSRHLPPEAIRQLRRAEFARLWLSGAIIAFLLTVPLVNFITPILATAAMVHIFKDLQARQGARGAPAGGPGPR